MSLTVVDLVFAGLVWKRLKWSMGNGSTIHYAGEAHKPLSQKRCEVYQCHPFLSQGDWNGCGRGHTVVLIARGASRCYD